MIIIILSFITDITVVQVRIIYILYFRPTIQNHRLINGICLLFNIIILLLFISLYS